MNQTSKLCLVVALALGAATGCGGEASEPTAAAQAALGSTWTRTYAIRNLAGLENMNPAGNYYLSRDIEGGFATWTPPTYFTGTLDGRGKTIKNLIINDTSGRAAAFFESTDNALIKNIRFTGITVTGNNIAAGVAGVASDSSFDQVAFRGTVSGSNEAGGLVGHLFGGSITRSYMKGTVSGARVAIGGLVAYAAGAVVGSYAQATVTGETNNASPTAGGVVGVLSDGGDVHDVYAVGNVTGRGYVGGVVGLATCSPGYWYYMYNGIYRGGDLVDANRANTGGWSGGIGLAETCEGAERWGALFYDTSSDQSGTHNTDYVSNFGYSAGELRDAVTPDGGVFCQWTPEAGHCLDNGFGDPPWNAGTEDEHHTLRGVLDEASQPL